ncbi:sensor histidine kinase [Microbacterium sp. No. 7]|uniref:sensor histidine kinase n=1 Tax=Microbacterium sp. No. 7 TaxID=1714373 RepID=UPI0006CF3BDF|nr:HAMP domain-containing sensor histidine kinase [Microbacterium sp. No. 7]ALJ18625.1 histidine kinase [Microbacterium sp. No. 7]
MTRRRWTLRRTLVVGTSALVAVAFLVTSLTTVLALRSFLFERLDQQVLESLGFALGPGDGPGSDSGDGAGPERGNGPPQEGAPGGSSEGEDAGGRGGTDGEGPAPRLGSLQVVLDQDGAAVSSGYTRADGVEIELTDHEVAILAAVLEGDRVPATVDLGARLGAFRVAGQATDDGTVVAGHSLDDVTATTTALTVIVVSVAGVTLLLAVVGLSLLVRRDLRPLDRVAGVAQRVSQRPLADGAVEIPERVDAKDTDPDTEVGRVGTSLNELLGHIQAALAARQHSEDQLRRFIADASHELRTPLASIRGYAQLSLREEAPMTATQQRALDRIASEAERMGALVDDLLLLARLDAGQTLRDDEVELTLLAVDAVSDAHVADPAHDWRLDVSEDLVSVPGDENRLRQVLANLLRNAQTHTPPGTIVTTSLTRDATHAILRVTDTGPGIDPAVADRLFDRFARGDHARNRDAGSTGLGLAIAHAITLAHGGALDVESVPGRTVFTVRLPLRRAHPVS